MMPIGPVSPRRSWVALSSRGGGDDGVSAPEARQTRRVHRAWRVAACRHPDLSPVSRYGVICGERLTRPSEASLYSRDRRSARRTQRYRLPGVVEVAKRCRCAAGHFGTLLQSKRAYQV
jgi:hypothetical protein